TREEIEALAAWWEEFNRVAVSVPLPGPLPPAALFYQDPASETAAVMVEARKVNEALLQLGCEVRLWWETETYTSMTYKEKGKDGVVRQRGGVEKTHHVFARGRFKLGQHKGTFKGTVLDTTACRSTLAASATSAAASPTWSGATARSTTPVKRTGARASS